MHCNLRTPDVAPVVLRFNYEAYNAQKTTNSTTLRPLEPQMRQLTKFEQNESRGV